jgi:hypothetical protein
MIFSLDCLIFFYFCSGDCSLEIFLIFLGLPLGLLVGVVAGLALLEIAEEGLMEVWLGRACARGLEWACSRASLWPRVLTYLLFFFMRDVVGRNK